MNLIIGGVALPVAAASGAVALLIFILTAIGRAVDRNGPRHIVSSIKNAQDAVARTTDSRQLALLEGVITKEFERLERRGNLFYRTVGSVLSVVVYGSLGVASVDVFVSIQANGYPAPTSWSGTIVIIFAVSLVLRLLVLFFEGRKDSQHSRDDN